MSTTDDPFKEKEWWEGHVTGMDCNEALCFKYAQAAQVCDQVHQQMMTLLKKITNGLPMYSICYEGDVVGYSSTATFVDRVCTRPQENWYSFAAITIPNICPRVVYDWCSHSNISVPMIADIFRAPAFLVFREESLPDLFQLEQLCAAYDGLVTYSNRLIKIIEQILGR